MTITDSIDTIKQSAQRFFTGTFLSRISGMGRDLAMAYMFGTGAPIAAFMVAFRLSNLLRRLFGEGALQSAFIPEFEALRHHSPEHAFRFFRNLLIILAFFLSLLILSTCGILSLVLTYASLSPKSREVIFLTILMLPSLLFICLYGFQASLLQCQKNYFTSSIAPIAFNGIWIACVFALKDMEIAAAMPWLAGGVIIATLAQWLMTVPKTLAILKQNLSIPLWQDVQLYSNDLKRLYKPLFLGIIGVAASQINNAVDSLFAFYAEAEGPALLWYAIRIYQLPLALFGIALSGALLPPLSRAFKAGDLFKYRYFLSESLKQAVSIMLPLTFFLLLAGSACVNLLYGRGDFNQQSVAGTTYCLWAYSLGLIPSTLVLILAPACYAQKDYRLPIYTSFFSMALNTGLNAILIFIFNLGAISVALATSVSAWMNLMILLYVLQRRQGGIFSVNLLKHYFRMGLAILMTCLGTLGLEWLSQNLYHKSIFWLLLQGQTPYFPRDFGSQLQACLVQVTLFTFFFIASIKFLKIEIFWPRSKTLKLSQ